MTFSNPIFASVAARPADATSPQIAALCWRMKRGKVEILLITSRETGRWVVPKGWPMADRPPEVAAEIEAWEEAGVRGRISPDALGSFDYDKLQPAKPTIRCSATVFALRVSRLEPKFPEQSQRRRKWFSARKAAKAVAEQELSDMIVRASAALAKR